MSVELIVGLLGSPFAQAVASQVATALAGQAVQHAVRAVAGGDSDRPPPASVRPEQRRLRVLTSIQVRSSLPGRARLEVQGLKGNALRATELVGRVGALDGVTVAEPSTVTGTLLVRFDPRRVALPTIMAAVEPARPSLPTDPTQRGERTLRLVGRESA